MKVSSNEVQKVSKIYKPKKRLAENEKECPMCHSIFKATNKYEMLCLACQFDPKN